MQKAYSLILGQCTELLKSKLKQSGDWDQVSTVYDLLGLTRLIKSIVFKFDDQKFLPVSLHQAKQNFYIMRQGQITNAEYLEKFNNLVDIASSYNGDILDQASPWNGDWESEHSRDANCSTNCIGSVPRNGIHPAVRQTSLRKATRRTRE
jgi:hypothetical protein